MLGGDMVMPYYDLVASSVSGATMLQYKGVTDARIAWRVGKDNSKIEGYYIYLNGQKVDSIFAKNDTVYTLKNLQPNTAYGVFVRAFDSAKNESKPNSTLEFTTYPIDNTPPNPPTNPTLLQQGDLSLKIQWSGATDVGSEIDGYEVYLNGALYNTTANGGPILTTTTVLKVLAPTTSYVVKIKSIDGAKNVSAFSQEYTFTTSAFDPLQKSPEVRKSRVHVYKEVVGRNEGFGINGSYFNSTFYTGSEKQLLQDLRPGLLRWGALDANPMSFALRSGNSGITYAKFLNQCVELDAYAAVTVGV